MQRRSRLHLSIDVSEKQRNEIEKADSLTNLLTNHRKINREQRLPQIPGNSGNTVTSGLSTKFVQ